MESFFFVAAICIITLELFTGFAFMGWSGGAVIDRDAHPGPYWFAIALHLLVGIVLPAAIYFVLL